MPRNFDELLSDDKTFEVRGITFHFKDVRPEVITSLREVNAENPNDIWEAQDEQILQFLAVEDHDAWKELRARTDDPVTVRQFNAILEYLVETQADRPTQTPSPSPTGPGRTARSSKAA